MSRTTPWADDFGAAGYKPYRDSMRANPPNDWYQGSWQKRVTDADGTRYFLNVDLWEFDGHRSASAHVQFHTLDNMQGDAINIDRRVNAIDDAEAFFAHVWAVLECGYYETDREPPRRDRPEGAGDPASDVPSEGGTSASVGNAAVGTGERG